jgi:hypothetical protein
MAAQQTFMTVVCDWVLRVTHGGPSTSPQLATATERPAARAGMPRPTQAFARDALP